jgi:hypothetical protein
MRDLQDILANVEPMSIKELEAHMQERSNLRDTLRSENRKLVPFLDQKWAKQLGETRGPSSLARVMNVGGNQ